MALRVRVAKSGARIFAWVRIAQPTPAVIRRAFSFPWAVQCIIQPLSAPRTHLPIKPRRTRERDRAGQKPQTWQYYELGLYRDPAALPAVTAVYDARRTAEHLFDDAPGSAARIVFGRISGPFPPAVAHRLLLSSLTAAIE